MLAQRLKELRKEKGITQGDLGEILGFGDSTISQYETGKRTPDQSTLQKLATYFEVSIDYLLGRTSIKKSLSSFEQYALFHNKPTETILGGPVAPELPDSSTIDMAKRIENLSDDNKQMIDKMLRALELEEKLKDEGVSGK